MEARQKETIPQEGTGQAGESLPELDSGCPTYSGGGNVLQPKDQTTTSKRYVQQAFHPSLFHTRPRSASLGGAPSTDKTTGEIPTANDRKEPASTPPTWQRVPVSRNPQKKRKLSTPDKAPEGLETINRYVDLPVDQQEDDVQQVDSQPQIKKVSKPPPIILYGVEDVHKLTELLESAVDKSQFTFKIVNRNQLRIMTNEVEVYKKLISTVRGNGLIGHTFNRKEERVCRIVIRNLHHSTPLSEIKEVFETTGNVVTGEIINARYGPDKKPTSTFFVNLLPGPQNIKAKEVKTIYHQKITIEEPKKRKSIVQCQRCQQYGHSKNYCMRPYRCLKCANSHRTKDCPKTDRSSPAKCALCLGPHPANYKGCAVYLEILERKTRKPMLQKRKTNNNLAGWTQSANENQKTTHEIREIADQRPTFAHITHQKPKQTEQTVQPTPPIDKTTLSIEDMFYKQTEKMDLLLQQMSTLLQLITALISKQSK